MSGKRWILICVLAVFLACTRSLPPACAQEWLFTVDRNVSTVTVNRDGSADIEYWLTYTCAKGAHPIDVVDLGLPNKSYRLGTAQAWYSAGTGGGTEYPLTNIRKSEYVPIGIEVHFGKYTIRPGR